jgi:hypothetical protein
MLFFHFIKIGELEKALVSVGITESILDEQSDPIKFIEDVAEYLNKQRFTDNYTDIFLRDNKKRYELGQISKEAYDKFIKLHTSENNLFDDNIDYDLIHNYFLEKWKIDLDVDVVYWFDYVRKREYMLAEENQITKRIRMRAFKANGKDIEANEYGLRMKNKYSI